MNVNAKSIGATRIPVASTLIVYLAFATIFSLGARAECGVAARSLAALAPAVQAMQNSAAVSPEAPSPQADWLQAQAQAGSDIPIIGLWKAIWVSSGTTVDVGFNQWHSDGTEVLNDTPPSRQRQRMPGNVGEDRAANLFPRASPFLFRAAGTTVVSIFMERNRLHFPRTATVSRVSSPGIRMTFRPSTPRLPSRWHSDGKADRSERPVPFPIPAMNLILDYETQEPGQAVVPGKNWGSPAPLSVSLRAV